MHESDDPADDAQLKDLGCKRTPGGQWTPPDDQGLAQLDAQVGVLKSKRKAARAALLLIKHGVFPDGTLKGERISSGVQRVAFPGLGTGVGCVPPDVCARQVRAAIDTVLNEQDKFPTTWAEASEQHQRLYRDRVTDLQFEE